MKPQDENIKLKLIEIVERLDVLELKINKIEKEQFVEDEVTKDKIIVSDERTVKTEQDTVIDERKRDQLLENKFGKYGLVWTGNIVLFFGIIFISQFIINNGNNLGASIMGFISVAALFGLSVLIRKTLPYIALIIKTTSILLLYYFAFRLHFFSENPLISSKWVCLIFLLILNGSHYYLSIKLKSKMFGVIALFLTITTSIVSNSTHFMLTIITLTSIISMYFVFKYNWRALLVLSVILVYGTLILWLGNNPVISGKFQVVKEHSFSIIYLFIIASVYTLLTLLPKNAKTSSDFVLGAILLNGIAFSLLVLLFVLSFYEENYIWVFFSVFVFCLGAAATLKFKSEWKFAAPLYAIYSFVMLSVSVYGYYKLPNAFFMLSLESLLVVSMALWFRSKFIVIMNGILFILLLVIYLSMEEKGIGINFAFALTALATARILNWKKERLEIKTDLLRNTYLAAAFIMILYAFYKAMPEEYITLTWTGTALLFYLLSRILNNVKYRWMAIFTFIITAFYLFIVDLDRIGIVYRIFAFMALAVISIIISIIYAKKSKKVDSVD